MVLGSFTLKLSHRSFRMGLVQRTLYEYISVVLVSFPVTTALICVWSSWCALVGVTVIHALALSSLSSSG